MSSQQYVVCVGLATLDTIVVVPRHPAPDGRVVASEFAVAGGGPAATAAVTLARLGIEAYFVGVVGDDETGLRVRDDIEREGVDVSELQVVPGARSPQSVILVGTGTRSICAYAGTVPPLELSDRTRELCLGASWVHVDHVGFAPMRDLRHEVRLSVDAGNPVEGLALDGVALYAPTEAALLRLFPARGLEAPLDAGVETVVVTRGAAGSAAATRADGVVTADGHPVDAVSTLRAGDVFHRALLAQLVHDAPIADALAFANRCAAMSCRGIDGRSAIPTAAELA